MNFMQPYLSRVQTDLQSTMESLQASDATFFDEDKYNEAELKRTLNLQESDADKKIHAMKQVLAAVSYGRDCAALFPDVVKNVATSNIELKKLTYIYLVQYADCKPQLALLSINSFQKDLGDRSQLTRASALRAMSSVETIEVIQIVMKSIRTASADTSAYVRKTACACAIKVYAVDSDQYVGLRDLVLKLFNDRNISVISSALVSFHHFFRMRPSSESEVETLAHLHTGFRRIVEKLPGMDQWAQTHGCDLLLRYAKAFFKDANVDPKEAAAADQQQEKQPKSGDYKALIECFRKLLRMQSAAVVLCAASALCYLAETEAEVKPVIPHLIRTLRSSAWDNMAVLFSGFLPVIRAYPNLWKPHISEFFVMLMDPPTIKLQKLEVLEILADERNNSLILRELQNYVRWYAYPAVVARSVRAITTVALSVESRVADQCLRDLVKMLDSKFEILSSESVVALRTLLQQTTDGAEDEVTASKSDVEITSLKKESPADKTQFWVQVVSQLIRSLADLSSPVARASVIWIIGEYQSEVPLLAPDAVRTLAKSLKNESLEVKHQILALAYKVWSYHMFATEEKGAVESIARDASEEKEGDSLSKKEGSIPSPPENLLERLELMLQYICKVAMKDEDWDLRDMGRLTLEMQKSATKKESQEFAQVYAGVFAKAPSSNDLAEVVKQIIKKKKRVTTPPARSETMPGMQAVQYKQSQEDLAVSYRDSKSWLLYSLSRLLDGHFTGYSPLPELSEATPDSIREPSKEVVHQLERRKDLQALGSQNHGSPMRPGGFPTQPSRFQQPSMIDREAVPKVETLDDLDLFYANEEKATVRSAAIVQQQDRAAAAMRSNRSSGRAFNSTAQQNTGPKQEEDDLTTFSLVSGGAQKQATPTPAPPTPVPQQIIEGEDEESDDDADWDLIKQNAQ